MSNFFEALESRMFLSASALVTTLHADEAAVKTDLATLVKAGAAAAKTIKADLKTGVGKSTAASQYKALTAALSKLGAGVGKVNSAAENMLNGDVNRLEADEAQLAKKPASTALTAKVASAKTTLTIDSANEEPAFTSANSGTQVIAALSNIVSDGGAAGADANTAITTLINDAQPLGIAAMQAYSTDVSAIAAA
jgi:hypothetical protein